MIKFIYLTQLNCLSGLIPFQCNVKLFIVLLRYAITKSDTPKVHSSEAIAVEEYLLKLYAAIIIVFFSFKQDTSPEY